MSHLRNKKTSQQASRSVLVTHRCIARRKVGWGSCHPLSRTQVRTWPVLQVSPSMAGTPPAGLATLAMEGARH